MGTAVMEKDNAQQGRTRRCLVTGGAGFLGRHLVAQLLGTGRYEVIVFDIRKSAEGHARSIVGDLRDAGGVQAACKGMDVVFHCATAAPTGQNAGNKALMTSVNVMGTHHIIAACIAEHVPMLIYTSTASVVFEGKDLNGVDESAPYASRPLDFYTGTKIQAEQLVLAANGRGGLATCALRPSGIFGEWDPLFLPSLVAQARQGKTKYIIGSGTNLMDFTYAGNVAQAHLQAAERLTPGSPAAGKAYFITNNDPQPFWRFVGDVLEPLGWQRPRIKLPFLLMFIVAVIFQWVIRPLVRPFKTLSTELTPSRMRLVTCNRRLRCAAAQQDLGYEPMVTLTDAVRRTVAHFDGLRAPSAAAAVDH